VLFNNLPKLILNLDSISDSVVKGKALNLVFSSIIIYRQFKVKSTPNVDTLTSPYTGTEDINTLLTGKFSLNNIVE